MSSILFDNEGARWNSTAPATGSTAVGTTATAKAICRNRHRDDSAVAVHDSLPVGHVQTQLNKLVSNLQRYVRQTPQTRGCPCRTQFRVCSAPDVFRALTAGLSDANAPLLLVVLWMLVWVGIARIRLAARQLCHLGVLSGRLGKQVFQVLGRVR